jgi:hypothetical protein
MSSFYIKVCFRGQFCRFRLHKKLARHTPMACMSCRSASSWPPSTCSPHCPRILQFTVRIGPRPPRHSHSGCRADAQPINPAPIHPTPKQGLLSSTFQRPHTYVPWNWMIIPQSTHTPFCYHVVITCYISHVTLTLISPESNINTATLRYYTYVASPKPFSSPPSYMVSD